MADYFTQFSCVFDTGSPANAKAAVKLYRALLDELAEGNEFNAGFVASLDETLNPSELWIRDDGGAGEPEHVIPFVKTCAESSASQAAGDSNGATPVRNRASTPSPAAPSSWTSRAER